MSHPDAYPISFVTLRRLTSERDRAVKPITAAFVKYLKGSRATASFRQRGMLLVSAAWPVVPGPRPEPQPQPLPEQPAPSPS